MMHHSTRISRIAVQTRRGVIVPLVAVAILLVGSSIALVLDHLWLSTAQSELLSTAEGSALAATRHLLDDELLRNPAVRKNEDDWQVQRIDIARQAAGDVARQNQVAGQNMSLDLSETGDVRFGRLVRQKESNQVMFLETDNRPSTVVVTAFRNRSRNNPVAILFQELVGESTGDVAARAEATWSNRIVGIRPQDDLAAPVMPIAILEKDASGKQQNWVRQIEEFQGADHFRYDVDKKSVVLGKDGLPEMTLEWKLPNAEAKSSASNPTVRLGSGFDPAEAVSRQNYFLLQLGRADEHNVSVRQMKAGWESRDLQSQKGELRLNPQTVDVWGKSQLAQAELRVLSATVGECRIFCLYQPLTQTGFSKLTRIRLTRLVGGRIMSVSQATDRNVRIVVQPSIVITRTALLAAAPGDEADCNVPPNPYIYKIHITQ
ncbi:MAG: hypothetical protein ACKVT0_23185 [Planctomycetaceae bacterium]